MSKDMQYLYERGLVSPGKKGWYLVNHIVLLKDRVASANHKYDDELFDLLHEMSLEGQRSYTHVEECIGCGLCVISCPTGARTMKLVRPPEHIPDPASLFDGER